MRNLWEDDHSFFEPNDSRLSPTKVNPKFKRVVRNITITLVMLLTGFLIVVKGIPRWLLVKNQAEILASVKSAGAIRLEEYGETVLTSADLKPQDFQVITDAFSSSLRGGSGISLKMCFHPHHRILFTSTNGALSKLEICFGCDQAKGRNNTVFDLPTEWQRRLRSLFPSFGIPIRKSEEY